MMRKFLFLFSASSVSKVVAILREVLFASLWGITAAADSFRAAITVTLAPVHVVTADALTSTLVPHYRAEKGKGGDGAEDLFASVAIVLTSFAVIAAVVLFAAAPLLTRILLPGFQGERLLLTTKMVRILAAGVPLYVWSSLIISLEVGEAEFRLPAFRPIVQNGGVAVAVVLGYLSGRPDWIAWGFTLTYAAFAIAGTLWLLHRRLLCIRRLPTWERFQERMAPFLSLLRPLLLLALLSQGNVVVEKTLSSLVGPGAVAALDYARFIPDAILMLFVLPLGLLGLASLSDGSAAESEARADRLASTVVVAFLPLSCFVFAASRDIVGVLYQRGTFSPEAAGLTTRGLMGMALGLWAVSLASILQKTLNAFRRNAEVLRAGAVGILANAAFNLLTYKSLGVLAFGIGFSLGGIVTALLCLRRLGKMDETRRMLRVCSAAALPYVLLGVLLNKTVSPTSLVGLVLHAALAAAYWGVFFHRSEGPRRRIAELRRLIGLSLARPAGNPEKAA